MNKSLKIYVTVDVEGEWSVFPNEQKYFDVNVIIKNLEILDSLISEAKRINSINLPITWFIRCDASVQKNLGSYEGLLRRLDKFIDTKLAIGDVFGIHPHLYSMNQKNLQNNISHSEIEDQLSKAFFSWESFFGSKPAFSRIGEARMDNFIASILDINDIKIDSTALPGRVRGDNGFNFNWSRTSNKSYKPSKNDYQVTSNMGINHNFTELPFTMLPTQGVADERIINRYFNLGFKEKIIENAINGLSKEDDVVCVVHPHEVTSNKALGHEIISYNGNSFLKNIKILKNYFDGASFEHF